jgi:hypothetical protein
MVPVKGDELIKIEAAAALPEKQVGAVVQKVGVDAEESRKTSAVLLESVFLPQEDPAGGPYRQYKTWESKSKSTYQFRTCLLQSSETKIF